MESKKRILIIEDEPDMREALQAALIAAGFVVVTCENTEIGLKSVIEQKPDLIVLDILTGSMHGTHFLQRLRDLSPEQNDSKVIILSNLDHEPTKVNSAQYNVEKYLVKAHVSLQEIVDHIKTSLA